MAVSAKITLSVKELSMVKDAGWILTKQAIIQKVYDLFATCIPVIKETLLKKTLPPEVIASIPKIYKGENYMQLPYVMLDYPRCFNGDDAFAVRTMFWWGNFFSITLHLSGKYKILLQENLLNSFLNDGFYIGIHEDQWAHHFMEDNYLPYQHVSPEKRIALFTQKKFIKLALKFDLDQWNEMPAILEDGYIKIAKVITNSPGGEIIL